MKKDESVIPKGLYCYTPRSVDEKTGIMKINLCPYWSRDRTKDEQESGYCSFIEKGDWELPGLGLLWDQCKECGVNMGDEDDYVF